MKFLYFFISRSAYFGRAGKEEVSRVYTFTKDWRKACGLLWRSLYYQVSSWPGWHYSVQRHVSWPAKWTSGVEALHWGEIAYVLLCKWQVCYYINIYSNAFGNMSFLSISLTIITPSCTGSCLLMTHSAVTDPTWIIFFGKKHCCLTTSANSAHMVNIYHCLSLRILLFNF